MSNGISSNTILSSIDNLLQKSSDASHSKKSDFITEKNSSYEGSSADVMDNDCFL